MEWGTGLRRQWAASFTSWCGVFPRGLGSWVFSALPVSEPSSQFNCWGGQEGAHWNLPWGGINLYRKGWMLRMRSIYPGLEGAWQQQCGQRDKQGAGTTPKAPGISLSPFLVFQPPFDPIYFKWLFKIRDLAGTGMSLLCPLLGKMFPWYLQLSWRDFKSFPFGCFLLVLYIVH